MINNELYIEMLKIIEDLKIKDTYEIINYDVKNDFSDLLGFEEGFSPLKKIEMYKASNINCDCDVALRSVLIYVMAFPFIGQLDLISNQRKEKREYKYKYFVKNSLNSDIQYDMNQKYYYDGMYDYIGDTMNSFTTTLNEFFRNISEDENAGYLVRNPKNNLWMCPDKRGWESYIADNSHHFEKILPKEAVRFLEVNHTIGNLIPVPGAFNLPRASRTKDYWDLTLLNLYEWFNSGEKNKRNKEIIVNLVGEENQEACILWLNNFEQWDDFVIQNYMQDFVNKDIIYDEDGNAHTKYLKPIMFWDGHDKQSSLLPTTREQMLQFFIKTTSMIELRGIRICEVLKQNLPAFESKLKDLL